MKRLALVLTVAMLGLAVAQEWVPLSLTFITPPYHEGELMVPDNADPAWIDQWGLTVLSLHELMTDGEKWAACTPPLVHIVYERYGEGQVDAWRRVACRAQPYH